MIDAKAEIAKAVEQARKEKIIGHSLDARITIAAPQKMRELIGRASGRFARIADCVAIAGGG